jgi:hypothetical protein
MIRQHHRGEPYGFHANKTYVNTASKPRLKPAASKANETSFGNICLNEMLKKVQVQTEATATEMKAPSKLKWL